ncbi:hypothetical protein B0H13DRAFT_2343454 [Mycena leptocephala]|nr:hypothetical protein B0H13DRAFT_2343454 [Mycena leptocephala]
MLRSHRILCSCVPAPFFVFLHHATPSHFHLHDRHSPPFRCFPHARSLSARPLAVCMTTRFPHARSLFPARPRLLAVSRTLTPARISTARSLFPARPLIVSCALAISRASPPPRLTSLRFTSLHFASPAKPSQAPNTIKTGYRTGRVWIWSSKKSVKEE